MLTVDIKAECEDVDYCHAEHKQKKIFVGTVFERTIKIGQWLRDAAFVDCLISPTGKQYFVGPCGHVHFAYDHCETTVSALEEAGWVHFSLAYYDPIVNDLTPTQRQLDTLFDIQMDGISLKSEDEKTLEQIKNIDTYIKEH